MIDEVLDGVIACSDIFRSQGRVRLAPIVGKNVVLTCQSRGLHGRRFCFDEKRILILIRAVARIATHI